MAVSESLEPRSLEYTPTWALASVAAFFVLISIAVERLINSLGHYLQETKRKPLYAALQKMKDELMLMGFISLTITILRDPVSKVCIPSSAYNKWTPCHISKRPLVKAPAAPPPGEEHRRRLLASGSSDTSTFCRPDHDGMLEINEFEIGDIELITERLSLCPGSHLDCHSRCLGKDCVSNNSKTCIILYQKKLGYEPFASAATLHELHIFIIVLALFHVVFSCITMLLALLKVYRWRKWEREAHMHATTTLASSADLLRRVTFNRQSTFVRYHTSEPWSKSRFIVWVMCFFQQFHVPRADYMALRLSFITTHNLKELYDFHAYMVRTMEDEFETIVGISSWLWAFVVILWVFNIDGTHLFFWTSLVPIVVVLTIGTKLQHVVATLALENSDVPRHLVAVLLKPRDTLFWFNRPKLLLSVIHLVLFETAIEFATFIWHVWQFGYQTCLLESNKIYVFGRLLFGLFSLLMSSYSTLPLYALVTQMGSSYKKAIVSKNVERVLRQWHKDAKHRLKVASSSDTSEHSTPSSSSLILHFKSKLSNQRHPLQQIGQSARLSSPIDISIEEGSLPDRTTAPQASNPLPMTARSIWERRHLRTGPPMEPSNVVKANPPETSKTTTTSATGSSGRLQFLTPHPASFQGRKLQRQLSLPMEVIRR